MFDAGEYGVLLYTLRRRRDYKKAAELAREVSDRFGVPTKERTIWAIERGEQVPGVDRHMAFCRVLRADPGYFDSALTDWNGDVT